MEKGYQADMTGPLIKRGVVGNARCMISENTATRERIECDVLYVDNSVHSGASGGPVFDVAVHAVGVIARRATTAISQSEYPNLFALFRSNSRTGTSAHSMGLRQA